MARPLARRTIAEVLEYLHVMTIFSWIPLAVLARAQRERHVAALVLWAFCAGPALLCGYILYLDFIWSKTVVAGREQIQRLRYERIPVAGAAEILEREIRNRFWSQDQFRELLRAAGFEKATFLAVSGGRAEPDATLFVVLARRTAHER